MTEFYWRQDGQELVLNSPTAKPKTSSFLWNKNMVTHVNCRGYIRSQYMEPEPSKYSYGPNMEAKTFIQPEQPFYTEHPGRFFYIKDNDTGEVFSAPYEPMRVPLDKFEFCAGLADVKWSIEKLGLEINLSLSLTKDMNVELWHFEITNKTASSRNVSVFACFSIGYMSWMNQSASFNSELNAIVAKSITPYQKVEDYFKNRHLKDNTFLISNTSPQRWCCSFDDFVGEGGLTQPDAVMDGELNNKQVNYEMPVAAMQYDLILDSDNSKSLKFVFGPSNDEEEIQHIKSRLLGSGFEQAIKQYTSYINQVEQGVKIRSNKPELDHFVNYWLPRQVFYHGDVNRLTTDPQTRNFVQDAMGLLYLKPDVTRERLLFAIAQQHSSGEMPDGILLSDEAELKYINQVPHADHCAWVPICLLAYLEETNDTDILNQTLGYADAPNKQHTVAEHVELAIEWLLSNTNEQGLSFISQGDWCDPMNMVGYKGKGVSSWLTMATSYALSCWLKINEHYCDSKNMTQIQEYHVCLQLLNERIVEHFKHGDWFGRGITDDGRLFGIADDSEGQIFLNPQTWAILCGAVNDDALKPLLAQVNQRLLSPHGVQMLAPSFTQMVEDIGRVTQKSAGVAENGSVYNHAAAFFAYALYQIGESEQGLEILMRMIGPTQPNVGYDQLPSFIPNYYRGAYLQFPDYAGRSSQLFNTGTVAWVYRCINEELCGVKGEGLGAIIEPKIPASWQEFSYQRPFRGATLDVVVSRSPSVSRQKLTVDGVVQSANRIDYVQPGHDYKIKVVLPQTQLSKPKLTILMGVSGSGKTAAAQALAKEQEVCFIDADDFHSAKAKAWMASGKPLNDEMRQPWLARLHKHLRSLAAMNQNCVLAYSGIKHHHRMMFLSLGFDTQFFRLNVSEQTLSVRLNIREGHFFPASLLTSQLNEMEIASDPKLPIIEVDANQTLSDVVSEIKEHQIE